MGTIGQRIKEIRKSCNLTQKEFAERLTMSQTHISKVEQDRDAPSDKLLKQISLYFSVSFEWLKTGEGYRDKDYDDMSKDMLNSSLSTNSPLFEEIIELLSSASYTDRRYVWGLLTTIKGILSESRTTEKQKSIVLRELFEMMSITDSLLALNYKHGNIADSDSMANIDEIEEVWRRSCARNMLNLKNALLYKKTE